MPQVFRIGAYVVFFWANETAPLEPIHVHFKEGIPSANATKIWLTKAGRCILCNNNSKIPDKILRDIMDVIEARSLDVVNKWYDFFWGDQILLLMSEICAAQTSCTAPPQQPAASAKAAVSAISPTYYSLKRHFPKAPAAR